VADARTADRCRLIPVLSSPAQSDITKLEQIMNI
jgi:hypothetical protein